MKTPTIFFLFLTVLPGLQAQSFLDTLLRNCGVSGSVTLYDSQQRQWWYSDRADARTPTLPASTFKIFNSLMALEVGAIADTAVVLPWDGQVRGHNGQPIARWNQDTHMAQAFRYSTVWFYVEMSRRIPRATYARYLRRSDYGNGKIYDDRDYDFWNHGSFAVSPREQINLLRRLQADRLPFAPQTQRIVREIMVEEKTTTYTLRAKTGWSSEGGHNGWYVGYLTLPDNVIYFATRLRQPLGQETPGFGPCRKEITRAVLRERGYLK